MTPEKMNCEKLRNLTARFKSKPVHGFDRTLSQNLKSTENRFNDCASQAAESMFSEAHQGPIHKLILEQKSKQNPEFNDYPIVV
jgi:hypothetical protein